jgi:hypothetical protein
VLVLLNLVEYPLFLQLELRQATEMIEAEVLVVRHVPIGQSAATLLIVVDSLHRYSDVSGI